MPKQADQEIDDMATITLDEAALKQN